MRAKRIQLRVDLLIEAVRTSTNGRQSPPLPHAGLTRCVRRITSRLQMRWNVASAMLAVFRRSGSIARHMGALDQPFKPAAMNILGPGFQLGLLF